MISEDEFWEWYLVLEGWKKSNLNIFQYSRTKGIEKNKLYNMNYVINYHANHEPEKFEEYKEIARKYLLSGMSAREAVDAYGINRNVLIKTSLYIRYQEIIEKKLKGEEGVMKFIAVPKVFEPENAPAPTHEPDVLKKQNDVELIISSGVKVVVSPEV